MTKINKSELMTRAWNLKKAHSNWDFPSCLSRAWFEAKKGISVVSDSVESKLEIIGNNVGWTRWEWSFIESMDRYSDLSRLSKKQIAIIDRMYNKVA